MPRAFVTILGKAVRTVTRLRGGGSALPGLIVERIDPQFIEATLAQLAQGVVVVSGTNGKTTTTKMVVELLESQGLKIFTNRTGSNFTRGVAAALLGDIDVKGNLNADIAVLELDEAHAVHFVRVVKPRYSLLLNVMRDQLDRFGEIDATARLLQQIAEATSEKVILNREDPRLLAIGKKLPSEKVAYFGLDIALKDTFPTDDDMRTGKTVVAKDIPHALSVLESIDGQTADFRLGRKKFTANLKLDGIYNIFNAAAALALVTAIVDDKLKVDSLKKKLESITPAFGRGETLDVAGQPLELVLVKNPSGFRLGLKSFSPDGYATMIAINDNYADGRDMSWLWDVDFDSLQPVGVAMVSGIRAYDMALRLQYDEVAVAKVEPTLPTALHEFISDYATRPKRIYCSYTAMLALRRELSKITKVEVVS
ncbi:MAG: MurT ligase domain-containing protein [Candidatus Saccharimonadales bacterium]